MTRILVLDDDAEAAEVMAQGLSAPGVLVHAFGDPLRALAALEVEPYDVLIVDEVMPFVEGADVIARAHERHPRLRVLMVSGSSNARALADRVGAAFLAKPFALPTLRRAVEALLGDGALDEQPSA